MMQTTELRQRFDHIEQTIHEAARACDVAFGVPMDVKDCVERMDQQTGRCREMIMHRRDDTGIEDGLMQCVDALEELGDRAREACEHAGRVDDRLRSAVTEVHRELSDLKHELHESH